MSGLNTLDKDSLLRVIARLQERITNLEKLLQGQPIGTARIADAAITNAKIVNLAAEKILAGELEVVLTLTVGDGSITIDGVNKRIVLNDGDNDRILIGYDSGGF